MNYMVDVIVLEMEGSDSYAVMDIMAEVEKMFPQELTHGGGGFGHMNAKFYTDNKTKADEMSTQIVNFLEEKVKTANYEVVLFEVLDKLEKINTRGEAQV